jgi:hypothetical protein
MTSKTAAIEGLPDICTLAASKAVTAKLTKVARGNVEPGVHEVAFDVHVEGSVTIGQDFEQQVANKAQPWNLVTALLEENSRLRTSAGDVGIDLNKLMAMAEAMDPGLVKESKAKAEAAAAAIKASTLTPMNGKVTTKLTVTPL